jgi:signal transduction histidine kinase
VQRIEDASGEWRDLAFALGALLAHAHAVPLENEPEGGERLMGLMVHELRTPVVIVKAYAKLLEAQAANHCQTAAGARELVSPILERTDLMPDWVNAMLDVQRLQFGDLRLELRRVDLVQLAWLVAEQFQHTTRRHRIRVLATRPPLPPILADRSRLRQVLSNLLENAVKYSAGGTIQIRLSLHDVSGGLSKAIIAVHDEGSGLEVDQLDRVFAPFEQTARTNVGLGLGLYLARQIARVHGGDLWAESRGRMNGSTFILALPLAA